MVGLGDKLALGKSAAPPCESAENNDWRFVAVCGGPQTFGSGAALAAVAFGIQYDQVGSVKICQLDSLFWPCGLNRGCPIAFEQRA